MRDIAVVWLAVLIPAAAAAAQMAGRPLAQVLEELQRDGLQIVFTSALVAPDMIVASEPTSREPREILTQILAPHGLTAHAGPQGQLVVVPLPPPRGAIRGRIVAAPGHLLPPGLTVRVVGTAATGAVDPGGGFEVPDIPSGRHELAISAPGLPTRRIEDVAVRAGAVTDVTVELDPSASFLGEVVVTPSSLRILGDDPGSQQFLTREEVARMPHVANDVFRAVKLLPGTTGGDLSAGFNVRGGEVDEVLVMLDGAELFAPFHLKDFQGLFSTVDSAAVDSVELLTGGFPVQYGDRMSGVMDISTATPAGPPTTAVSVGTLNAHVLTEGTFDEQRGAWLVSARGWYPDRVLDLAGINSDELRTDYSDVLAKLEHALGRRSRLSVNVLLAEDAERFRTADGQDFEEIDSRESNRQMWLGVRTEWNRSLRMRTVLSLGRDRHDRRGGAVDIADGILQVDDRREFEHLGLRQDWSLELGDRQLLKGGFDLRLQRADYDYTRVAEALPGGGFLDADIRVTHTADGHALGAWAADRFRLGSAVVAELGLRWDRQSWRDEAQLSPRLNLRYAAGERTTWRAAWGIYHQSQRLDELQVEDGVTAYLAAQGAEHWLVSVEHRPTPQLVIRLEAFAKRFDRLRPRYENQLSPHELFPEARSDRIRVAPEAGRADGVELLLKRDPQSGLAWWLGAALTRAEDRIDGSWVPRSWDQRWGFNGGLSLDLPRKWSLSLAASMHSGWPTTGATAVVAGVDPSTAEVVLGPRNHERFPTYGRLDLRGGRTWSTSTGRYSLVVELLNVTNRKNLCCVTTLEAVVGDDGAPTLVREYGFWAPLVPSVSLRWEP